MKQTTNRQFNLPEYTDVIDIEIINENFREIDSNCMYIDGGKMNGSIDMQGNVVFGLNDPTEASHVANKGYVDNITSSVTVVLTSGGWINNTQTISVDRIKTESDIIVSPTPESFMVYIDGLIRCTAQGYGSLTFTCDNVPLVDVFVNVLIHK